MTDADLMASSQNPCDCAVVGVTLDVPQPPSVAQVELVDGLLPHTVAETSGMDGAGCKQKSQNHDMLLLFIIHANIGTARRLQKNQL